MMMHLIVIALVVTSVLASDATCQHWVDVDINPHTAGIGHAGAASIQECCDLCSSPEWFSRGCRFYTLSKGNCWFKADNASVVKSPGKISGHATSQVDPPAPPPWPKHGTTGDWIKVGPTNIGDSIDGKGESGTLADAVSPWGNPKVIYTGGRNNGASSGILKSVDGGDHWVIKSKGIVARTNHGLIYSWTAGETLIMMGSGGVQSDDHPHAAFVWVSKDDGETWVDETSDMLVTMGPGAANWYENDFYINSMGQGIMYKTLE